MQRPSYANFCHCSSVRSRRTLIHTRSFPFSIISMILDESRSDFRSFLGRNLLSLPPNQVLDLNEHRLSRWQMVQQIIEGFGSPVITCILFNNAQNGALFNWSKSAKSFLCVTSGSIEPRELGQITMCHLGDELTVVSIKVVPSTGNQL